MRVVFFVVFCAGASARHTLPYCEDKMKKIIVIVFALLTFSASKALAFETAPRITDREIIESLAEIKGDVKRLEEGQRILQKQVDDTKRELKEFLLWGFGVTFAGIFALIGFVLWDRRSALVPAVSKITALEKREELLEKALKEMARKDTKVAEALRHAGLIP